MEQEQKQQPVKSQTGMPVKTLILVIILAAAAILLLSFALKQKNIQLPNIVTNQVKESTISTTLSLSSDPTLDSTSYTDDITIDTGTNNVTGVQLELAYDPKVLTAVDVTPGTFFPNSNVLIKKVDTISGRITYALGVSLGEKGKTGKGVIASLHFALVPGNVQPVKTSISFLPKTQVSSSDTIESVLKDTVNASLTLGQSSAPLKPATNSAQ